MRGFIIASQQRTNGRSVIAINTDSVDNNDDVCLENWLMAV